MIDPAAMMAMMAGFMPGQTLSQAQQRYLKMLEMVNKDFEGKDQYVMMTPKVGPHAVKVLTPEHAAQAIYDQQGRLATEEEIELFKLEDKMKRAEVQKQIDRQDLAKSVRRVLKD